MMYEDQRAYLSPLGGLSSPTFEQDFWPGAKPSTSSSPVTSTKQIDYQDGLFGNMDMSEFPDPIGLDGIVPSDLSDFGPEDLFPEMNETEPLTKPIFLTHADNTAKTPQNITIKLKKVKHPKINRKHVKMGNTNLWSSVPVRQIGDTRPVKLEQVRSPQSVVPVQVENIHPVLSENIDFLDMADMLTFQESEQPVYVTGIDYAPLYTLESEMTESRLSESENPALAGDISLIDAVNMVESDAILDSLLSDNEEKLQVLSGENTYFEFLNSPSSYVSENWSQNSTSGGSSPELSFVDIETSDAPWSPYNNCSTNVDNFLLSSTASSPLSSTASSPIQHTISSPEYDSFTCVPSQQVIEVTSQKQLQKIKKNKLTKEVKYLRKKRQNKEAALRYRQKKKCEESEMTDTLKQEEVENAKLKKDFKELRREIEFVKKLMRETFTTE